MNEQAVSLGGCGGILSRERNGEANSCGASGGGVVCGLGFDGDVPGDFQPRLAHHHHLVQSTHAASLTGKMIKEGYN